MDSQGILTLLPPLAIIVFAIITKKTFETLLFGVVFSMVFLHGFGFLTPTMDIAYTVIGGNVWVILVLVCLGIILKLFEKTNATVGFTRVLLKVCDRPKKTMFLTWIMGIIVFIDSYLNMVTVGTSMKGAMDRQRQPREMLAYILTSTGSPVCLLIPLSTWVVFFGAVFEAQPELASLGTGADIYISSIPYMFYAWIAVIMVPLVALGIIPKYGPMKKAYGRVENGGEVYSPESAYLNTEKEENKDLVGGTAFDFLIPIALTVIICITTGDILIGLLAGVAGGSAWYFITRKIKFDDWSMCIADGMSYAAPLAAITLGALMVREAMAQIGLSEFVVETVAPILNVELFPAITFLLVSALAFITGSSWGVPALTVPIIIPLCASIGADPVLTIAALLSGAGFGAHACFYGGDLVVTAGVVKITPLDHFKTQIPFAATAAGMALVAFIVAGMIL